MTFRSDRFLSGSDTYVLFTVHDKTFLEILDLFACLNNRLNSVCIYIYIPDLNYSCRPVCLKVAILLWGETLEICDWGVYWHNASGTLRLSSASL